MSETLRQYDRWAASYDSGDNPLIAASGWALGQVPFECGGADVLELGCGTGRHVAPILAAGARSYTGVDGSAGMLAVARERHDGAPIRFVEGDLAQPLALPDGSFDRVLIVLVLEHLAELDGISCEVARVLRPAGQLRIVDIHPDLVARGAVASFEDHGTAVRFASLVHAVRQLVGALERAGLELAMVRELVAEEALLEAVPKLAKHRGHPVLVDVAATLTVRVRASSALA